MIRRPAPRILSPSPIVSAAFIAAQLRKLTIALLGPIVPHSNPVRLAEELAMLDTMVLRAQANQAPFTLRVGVRDAMMALDARNIAGEAQAAVVTGALPTTFVGSPDTVVEQIRRCREVVGAGVLDLSLHTPGSAELEPLMRALELFGRKVLPRIREM